MREARGALELETLEARPIFDDGTLADLAPDESNRAKELIEDFMVAANGVVARFLESKGFPSLRRVLRTPERWDRIVALAAQVRASAARAARRRWRSTRSCTGGAQADPDAFRRSLAVGREAPGLGRVRAGGPRRARRRATSGSP